MCASVSAAGRATERDVLLASKRDTALASAAGFDPDLTLGVWVGYDDYSDVKLTGAVLAAPVWAEFMNRAIKLPQYSDMKAFTPPAGVTNYRIDKASNLLADDSCPTAFTAA